MDAVKFIKERDRMRKSYYDAEKGHCSDGCPAHAVQCTDLDDLSTDVEELVALVEEWSSAHSRKTRQSVFLEQYPNCMTDDDGVVGMCPRNVDKTYDCDLRRLGGCTDFRCDLRRLGGCADCRREFWMQEVE